MDFPRRIVDLHTHMFNAHYLPLASIIADAMGKEESALANGVAALLLRVTGSSYKDDQRFFEELHFEDESAKNEYLIDQIWKITQHELLSATGSQNAVTKGAHLLRQLQFNAPIFLQLHKSDLSNIVDGLATIDYAAEGYVEEPQQVEQPGNMQVFRLEWPFGNVLDGAEQAVKKALRAVIALMDPQAWGAPENYLEFFLTMLKSEEDLFAKIIEGYGPGLPSLQVVHFMMDMQYAYPGEKAPDYPFFPDQVVRMEKLQRKFSPRILGFCAFDPRRPGDWRARAVEARGRGFLGFKFYPPLGYKPTGNDAGLQTIIDAFFDFCIENDIPIFAHCTAEGFQTHLKQGGNAHPNNWKTVLENPRWHQLRLCLGHAGGGHTENKGIVSPGWMAKNKGEWTDTNNFARIVTELCTTYPNVYCEVANMAAMLDSDNEATFIANLELARTATAGNDFDLMDKMAYGTDWFMPDMVDNTRSYFQTYLRILNRSEYRPYLDKFFWQNAYRYMKVPE